MTTKEYLAFGKYLYLVFVALSLYAINTASNGMLIYAAKYLLSWVVWTIQAFVF